MKFNRHPIYSGAGNTFVILEEQIPSKESIQTLCITHQTDGLIVIENQSVMHYFNADGSEADLCGNGLRCVIKYLWDQGQKQHLYTIATRAGLHTGTICGSQ